LGGGGLFPLPTFGRRPLGMRKGPRYPPFPYISRGGARGRGTEALASSPPLSSSLSLRNSLDLLDQEGGERRCGARVHNSEAPFVATLIRLDLEVEICIDLVINSFA
jgi:hypothetical protein